MNILLAENAGFCFGVRRAVSVLEEQLLRRPARICTLGELIHNPTYLAELRERGVTVIDEEEAECVARESSTRGHTVLLLRTHGVSLETERRMAALSAAYPNFEVIDVTCPFVKKIHTIADKETDEGTLFLLLGKKGHPEVVGISDRSHGEFRLIDGESDLSEIVFGEGGPFRRVVLAAQTTFGVFSFEKTKKNLKKVCTNSIFFDTICSVTQNRQSEVLALAERSDLVIVIGGKNSSNTKELYLLAKSVCPDTRWIETAAELPRTLPSTDITVAIAAGASTPDGLIKEVYQTMEEIKATDFEALLEESINKTIHTGETVEGIVTSVAKDAVYVDVGVKATGLLTRDQITDDPNAKLSEMFKPGDVLRLFVIRVNDTDGIATLSKKRIDRDKSWFELVDMKESGGVIEGPVTEVNRGGVVITYLGNKVFVPASQSGLPKDADLSVLLGTTQRAAILDVDTDKKRAVASIRKVTLAEKKEKEQAIWDSLEVGAKYTGVVKTLATYGAFVDIGGVDGMVHNSELAWKHIRHSKEVVSVGQVLEVYIKDIDRENRRISLGYKTEANDPWTPFLAKYAVGDLVTGKIVSMTPFGAFMEVMDGVDGLIHISQIALEKIDHPKSVLTIGEEVTAKITEIDTEHRRLSLSIRALLAEAKKAADAEAAAIANAEAAAEAEAAAKAKAEEDAEMAAYIVRSID